MFYNCKTRHIFLLETSAEEYKGYEEYKEYEENKEYEVYPEYEEYVFRRVRIKEYEEKVTLNMKSIDGQKLLVGRSVSFESQ